MANPLYSQRDIQYGITYGNHASVPVFSTTNGLAIATAGLPIESSIVFNKNVNQRVPDRMNGQRVDTIEDSDYDVKGSIPTVSIKCPYTAAIGDLILGSIFQGVSEGASTPYPKTFDVPSTYPDFSTDTAGCYLLFAKSLPSGVGSYDEIINSCVAKKVTFSCYPDQNEGRLTIDADFIGRYFATGNYSGTLSYPTTFAYNHFADLTSITIAGSAVICSGFTITMESQVVPKPIGGSTTLATQNYSLEKWKVTGSVDIEMGGAAAPFISAESAGTSRAIALYWGSNSGATSGDLYFNIPTARFYSHAHKGNENDIRTLNFQAFRSIGGGTKLMTVIMANAIDRGATWSSAFWG